MKKNLLLTTLVAFLTVGCGTVPGSSSTSTSGKASEHSTLLESTSTTSSSSTSTSTITSSSTTSSSTSTSTFTSSSSSKQEAKYWTEEEEALMTQVLGFTLPYPDFTVARYAEISFDDDGEFFYVYADNEDEAILSNYLDLLELNGYTLAGVDSSYGYDLYLYSYEFGGSTYVVQTDYFPGNSTYDPCFEIYAWLYEEGNGGSESEGNSSDTYPEAELSAWLEANGVTSTVPSFDADYYEYIYDETQFVIACEDFGTPGVDAIEDTYKVALEELGWTIDDSLYDSYGYYAYSPDGMLESLFYTYEGNFVVGHTLLGTVDPSEPEGSSTTFPQAQFDAWLESLGLSLEVPTFESDFYIYESSADEFIIGCFDYGTIGVDAIEDTYKAALEELGWTIDDSLYDYYGYVAVSPANELTAIFFSWDGEFYISYAPYVEDNGGSEEEEGELSHFESYPQAELDAFKAANGLTCPIPTFEETTGYGYYSGVAQVEGISGDVFVIQVYDFGVPGVDSIEDSYLVALEELGWEIDDSLYDSDGYYASYPGSNAEILFYSYNSVFAFFLYTV